MRKHRSDNGSDQRAPALARKWEDPTTIPILKRRRGSLIKRVELKPEFVTIDEAAEHWRCSRRKVERKLKKKEIPKFKDGHRTLLRIKDVRAHSRKMRQK